MRFEGTGGEKSGGEYFQWCFVSHNIQVRKSLHSGKKFSGEES